MAAKKEQRKNTYYHLLIFAVFKVLIIADMYYQCNSVHYIGLQVSIILGIY